MVRLSEVQKAFELREVALSDEERAERKERRSRTAERLEREYQRILEPLRIMERMMAPARILEQAVGPMLAVQQALDDDTLRITRELAESPTVRFARELASSPNIQLVQELAKSTLANDICGLSAGSALRELMREADANRSMMSTGALGVDPQISSPIPAYHLAFPALPPAPASEEGQERRAKRIEKRMVRIETRVAAFEAKFSQQVHRTGLQSIRDAFEAKRLAWIVGIATAVIGAILGALATLLFT